jgi:hypothetical protein
LICDHRLIVGNRWDRRKKKGALRKRNAPKTYQTAAIAAVWI